jgi:hypothetical protein
MQGTMIDYLLQSDLRPRKWLETVGTKARRKYNIDLNLPGFYV